MDPQTVRTKRSLVDNRPLPPDSRTGASLRTPPVETTEHPRWAARSVSLICGPPGSGKSTLAAEMHPTVLELERFADVDDYRQRLRRFGLYAYRIGRASHVDIGVVRGAASVADREHHEGLCRPARTIVLLTPASVCHDRVEQRGRDTASGEHAEIDRWWSTWRSEHAGPEGRSSRWAQC